MSNERGDQSIASGKFKSSNSHPAPPSESQHEKEYYQYDSKQPLGPQEPFGHGSVFLRGFYPHYSQEVHQRKEGDRKHPGKHPKLIQPDSGAFAYEGGLGILVDNHGANLGEGS